MRRFLSTILCCVFLLGLGVLPVSATDTSQDTTIVATLTSGSSVDQLTASDLVGGAELTDLGTLTLLSDLTIDMITTTEEGNYTAVIGWIVDGPDIDLNGHTLTFKGPENVTNCVYFTAIQGTKNVLSIENGTIIVSNVPEESNGDYLYAAIGFVQGQGAEFSNLEILVEGGNALATGVSFMEGSYDNGTLLTLENCVIDVGTGSTAITAPYTYKDSNIVIRSGSYNGLMPSEGSELSTTSKPIVLATDSAQQTVTGVTDGTTVITSAETTAIIVQDGRAYTYDTLQEALDASAARATVDENGNTSTTILLVKDPEENVTIPESAPALTFQQSTDGGIVALSACEVVGHSMTKTEAKEATCTEAGNKEYWTCSVCDKLFSDEAGTTETTIDAVTISAAGHSYGTEWKSDETNHWHECACGEKSEEAAHTLEWVIDKEATATEKGSKHQECSVCGYKSAAVEIPATASTGDTTSPQTGDGSNMTLWFTLMAVSVLGLGGTLLYGWKRKASR